MSHRIDRISFRHGLIDCTCGTAVASIRGDTPDDLSDAWLAHRRAVGAGSATANGAAYAHGDEAYEYGRDYPTAIGTSKLSARVRGLMGVAAKRKKRSAA